jgi:hypothetical protein
MPSHFAGGGSLVLPRSPAHPFLSFRQEPGEMSALKMPSFPRKRESNAPWVPAFAGTARSRIILATPLSMENHHVRLSL